MNSSIRGVKMTKVHKLFISKIFALLLTVLLFHGPYPYGSAGNDADMSIDEHFAAALKDYQGGLYEAAAEKFEQILPLIPNGEPELKAKACLALGACYEKSGKKEKAATYYRQLKIMNDNGQIDEVPVVPGIDPESLPGYRKLFAETSLVQFDRPVAVSEIMNNNVVHAPRKSIDQKAKEKRKKKFPWLIAIGAVVIIGTAAVLLLTSKKNKPLENPDIEWIYIPAGEFLMGDGFNEGDPDELPQHVVDLDDYYISRHETTYNQYIIFCDDTGRKRPAPTNTAIGDPYKSGIYPVGGISWNEAWAFCQWLSARTGDTIRLPTEAQWEKAARGGDQDRYPWGNEPPDCTLANYFECGETRYIPAGLRPVDSCHAGVSPYGISNMAGNVSEWCRDWYGASYYSESLRKNPLGPASGSGRVVRGGDITSNAGGLRTANRDFLAPGSTKGHIGFRVVKEN
jgi:formylglycine-generating enzyme required for sulfatase activity